MRGKICLIAGIIFIAALFSMNAAAAEKGEKIGFINLKEIMQKSSAGKKAGEDFKKLYEKDAKAIKTAEAELKKLKGELDKQGAVLTPAAKSEKEETYRKKLRAYQLQVNDTNEELKKRDREMMQKLMPRIMKIVNSIAEKEKYTLIMDVATMPVPYWSPQNEITKKVIDELNKSKK